MTETHKRTIIKSITWRIVATAVTAFWTGISGAIIINIWMTIAYYIHERAWVKISWGRYANSLAQNHDAMDTKTPISTI